MVRRVYVGVSSDSVGSIEDLIKALLQKARLFKDYYPESVCFDIEDSNRVYLSVEVNDDGV